MTECDKPYKAKPMERQADGFNVIGPTADGLVLKIPCPSLGEATFLAMALNLAHDRGYSLATAALAERDKEIERMSNTLKTVKAAMEVVSRTELDGSGGRDAIARRVEKRHGNAMAMAFKEVFDVLAAT